MASNTTLAIRRLIWDRQDGGKCHYCKRQCVWPPKLPSNMQTPKGHSIQPYSWTMDHIIPKSKGGWGYGANVVGSCWECNRKKGDKLPPEEQWPDLPGTVPVESPDTPMENGAMQGYDVWSTLVMVVHEVVWPATVILVVLLLR